MVNSFELIDFGLITVDLDVGGGSAVVMMPRAPFALGNVTQSEMISLLWMFIDEL